MVPHETTESPVPAPWHHEPSATTPNPQDLRVLLFAVIALGLVALLTFWLHRRLVAAPRWATRWRYAGTATLVVLTASSVAAAAGYGFTRNFDMEAQLGLYDGMTLFGANAEVWVLKREPFDFSIALGLHARRGDKTVDATGIDLTFLPSKHVTDKLDIYGGLDFAFESISDRFGGGSFKTVHVVPGLEYKLNPDLDFVAELGLAVNDAARHCASAGLAYYFR